MDDHRIGSLATFGYGSKAFNVMWEIENALVVNKRAVVVDTRMKPACSWSDLWAKDFLSSRWEKRYIWKGDLLGNVNYATKGAPIQLADETAGIAWIIHWLEKGWSLLLLCGCPHYETCHRKVIYDLVKARLGNLLLEFEPGQRVMTPDGPGTINPGVPAEVHRARNRYGVLLDRASQSGQYAFFPHELEPFAIVQQSLIA